MMTIFTFVAIILSLIWGIVYLTRRIRNDRKADRARLVRCINREPAEDYSAVSYRADAPVVTDTCVVIEPLFSFPTVTDDAPVSIPDATAFSGFEGGSSGGGGATSGWDVPDTACTDSGYSDSGSCDSGSSDSN